ncbi:collagen alpha-2(I) chain [Nycticebus coucang]|uniref:collagen alpha-2(I) chain n=1 Tax=Nycticebus coucang TaxID=9470 RepID=UPI00234D357D|nr:collagen alpha-2(I) chain [Nycticebus coucang]
MATGRLAGGAFPRLRGNELAKMPGRCVGPSRSGRGVRRPWGKRWGAGTFRGRGARRRALSSVWETRCVSAERLQDCRRPRGSRQAVQTADTAGENEASGTPGIAGSFEAARDSRAVWVNGAVGDPEVVGSAGYVWVTGSGEEESEDRSPGGSERKGRPGSLGHESILQLWLKVQAMRAASGCGEGSRVELHPVPAGEGPVERGVPGRASWVETSRGGVTGPWVKGQARVFPRVSRLSTALGLGEGCERASGFCGLGPAGWVPPPVDVSGIASHLAETSPRVASHLLGREQTACVPGAVEEISYGVAPGPWGKGQTVGLPGGTGWPGAVEGEVGYRGAPGLSGRGQIPGALEQEAVCGDIPSLWRKKQDTGVPQAVGIPRGVEEEITSVGVSGIWQRRQAVEETDSGGIPGLWGTGQPAEVPCATEEEPRCGGDPRFRERELAVWVDPGSGGDPGSCEAAETAELSGPSEQEAGSGGASGLWGIEQAMGVPRALGKEETSCASFPGLWRTEQPVEVSQAVAVPGAMGQETSHGGVPGLWDRQQALGRYPAVAVSGLVGEETCSGNVPSLWERRQVVGEQGTPVPSELGGPCIGAQEAGCRGCVCRRRQSVGLSETVEVPKAADVPKHRCALAGVHGVDMPVSGKVPAALWVSGPMCQEGCSRAVLNLWERAHVAGIPVASGGPLAPEEPWPVGEDSGSRAFPGPQGGRQGIGVPVSSEVPGFVGRETGSGGVQGPWGGRQSVRAPVATEVPTILRIPGSLEVETGPGGFPGSLERRQTAGVPTNGGAPVAPRVPRSVWEETGSGSISGFWGEREITGEPADAMGPTRMGVPASARMPGPMLEETSSGGLSGLSGDRQTPGVSMAEGLPGSVGVETLSEGLLDLSGRRQVAGTPVAFGVSMTRGEPMASGLPGPMAGDTVSVDNSSGIWGGRLATEVATEVSTAARIRGPVEGDVGSEGVSGPWKRRLGGVCLEAVRVPPPLGVLAAVGVPMAGRIPAAVWVTGSPGTEVDVGVSGLAVVRRQSVEGVRAFEEETGGRSTLGLAGRSQAVGVSHTCVGGPRVWSCPKSVGEETAYEDITGVSERRTAVRVTPGPREETGLGHFRGHPQQSGRRQAGGMSAVRVRGQNRGENSVGEDRLRGMF